MGMAAGQARLLSITSRMSDNELRAQIINNNKMRLATESSQASEAYVAALNEAQLMFSSYDAENNTTYQNLTYNALTAFNPYNNQYALINSSGNVLLSEKDAENYRASGGNLDVFLSKYGLEYATTYFEQLGDSVVFEDFDKMSVSTANLMKLYSANASAGDKIELGKVGTVDLYDTSKNTVVSYMGTANSETMYQYDKYLQQYYELKDKYLAFIVDAMKDEFKNLVKAQNFKNGSKDLETPADIKAYLNDVIAEDPSSTTAQTMMTNIYTPLIALFGSMKGNNYTNGNVSALDSLKKILENNSGEYAKDEFRSDEYCYMTDKTNLYIVEKDDKGNPNKILYKVETDGKLKQRPSDSKIDDGGNKIWTDGTSFTEDVFTGTPSASNGTKEGWNVNPYVSPSVYSDKSIKVNGLDLYQVQTTTASGKVDKEVNFDLYTKNDVQNMATIAKSVITSIESSIDSYWDSTATSWTTNTNNSNLNTAYQAYKDAAKNLCELIFGTDIPSKYDDLGDMYKLYNDYNISQPFTSNFKKVFLNLVMDEVLDTYGEPKYTWIDKTEPTKSYNTNGEAKAAWYENLFNRIQAGGYQVLQDGLASSSEWIQFAFESGIVTMEQVDSLQNWNPLIYSNCSDITSQTNDAMIAKAEAEYRNAMNKIENKDKRYDLELKNIDTEHNSLMAEYESIKTAIDKNIERTFKLYS